MFGIDTLMVYHRAKNLPILSRDKEEETPLVCLCGQTDTHTESKTENNRSANRAEWR